MDFLPNRKIIKQSYIICSTGRSGSTLLSKTLKQLNCCGKPEEYFHLSVIEKNDFKGHPERFLDYCDSILKEGTTSNGVFSVKLHWWHFYNILVIAKKLDIFQGKDDIEIISTLFPNPKFIYIWRQDMVKQAVSTVIALQSGVWLNSVNKNEKQWAKHDIDYQQHPPVFKPLNIYRWQKKFKDQNRRWKELLNKNSLDYYEVTYERLANNFKAEIEQVGHFLELDPSKLTAMSMPTKRQSNSINQRFIQYYQLFPTLLLRGMDKVLS